ncbi:MAG: enoyl-CoA hydratase/isomerase family protein [Burkholderiaceae bacterium]|nr:enoyl-CoA hydratase/isomerase family protein [Burkholderiaceae bacterium]
MQMFTCPEVVTEVHGHVGCLTLVRPAALNALSLPMIRALTAILRAWRKEPAVAAVAVRGSGKTGPFGAFCAGGDIRFFHEAALAGSEELDAFFTEEYTLNHLIHTYPKPYIAFMDGIVMGGGMGISQGAQTRIVTERTKMAMPETNIGLFPDVGGGYFLSRCPGRVGEWLALTGEVIGAGDALEFGLADICFDVARLPSAWSALATIDFSRPGAVDQWLDMFSIPAPGAPNAPTDLMDRYFSLNSVSDIVHALEADRNAWAQHTAATLRRRSPLMLHVVLEQVRRAREMTLADNLRMERNLVHHCFHPGHLGRSTSQSETVEGIRALAVDKDHTPHWNPASIEAVTHDMVAPFFSNPWPLRKHPLRELD